jgi:hypothetical protein
LKSGRVSGSFALILVKLKILEYSEKDNTLLVECSLNGAVERLRLLVSRRTVPTQLLDAWQDQVVEVMFTLDGWVKEVKEASGQSSNISQLVYRGLKRRTREGPRHLILSGRSEEEGFHVALVCGVRKRLTPGSEVSNLLINYSGEVCDISVKASMEVKEVRPRTTEG